MTKLNKYDERLIRLADKLEGKGPYEEVGPVPTRKFSMQHWYSEHRGGTSLYPDDFNPDQCKTAACACGWAATDPWFRQRKFAPDRSIWWDRVCVFFGMLDDEARSLFQHRYYMSRNPTPATVAKRIRKFVADRQPS